MTSIVRQCQPLEHPQNGTKSAPILSCFGPTTCAGSRWIRFAPAFVDWPMHEQDYDDRQYHTPWPEGTPETVTTQSPWPANTPETMTPTRTPVATLEEYKKLTDKRLGELKRELDDE